MRALLLGQKPIAAAALRHLIDSGIEVVAVVAEREGADRGSVYWSPTLRSVAQQLGVAVISEEELYAEVETAQRGHSKWLGAVDLVLSVLFPRRILPPLIALPRVGCFNFHPGPLPEFRGRRGYNFAILEDHREYGASVHWVTDGFDAGPIVEVRRFLIDGDETALSLQQKTMVCLERMFEDFIEAVLCGQRIAAIPQGEGRSATRRELVEASRILPSDDASTVARKIRAFWYPPYVGARLEMGGVTYTLVDERILAALAALLHNVSGIAGTWRAGT